MQARTRRDAQSVRVPRARTGDVGGRLDASAPTPATERPELRLALARGALGIELDRPFSLGAVVVEEISIALPAVRFPVDLSGGVSRFRHQRGELVHLVASLGGSDLERHAATRLRGVLGDGALPEVTIAPFVGGAVIGLATQTAALCFDVRFAPFDEGVRVLVDRARGLGLSAPAHGVALRALSSLASSMGRLARGVMILDDVATPVLRRVLPLGGARLPACRGVRVSLEAPRTPGSIRLRAARDVAPAAIDPAALSLLELADLCGDADDALARGELSTARAQYLSALERAPRHPALTARIASIDHAVGDRADAALATLVETQSALDAGILGATLLAATGDVEGASVAFARAGADETWSRLAALAWLSAARLAPDAAARAHALDEALARAPLLLDARRTRLAERLGAGDLQGARADAELLEAGARGASARFEEALRSAHAFLDRGYPDEAVRWFERALRVSPDDATAVLGLGRALRDAGRPRRALDLFARAVALAERRGESSPTALLDLAKELVTTAGDRPAAIARVRAVAKDAPEAAEARALEVRWRLEIGDRAGAKLAASRVADALELSVEAGRVGASSSPSAVHDDGPSIAAGSIAREVAGLISGELGDLDLARRILLLAVRAAPRDRRAAAELRRLTGLVAPTGVEAARVPAPPPPPSRTILDGSSLEVTESDHPPVEASPSTMGESAPMPPAPPMRAVSFQPTPLPGPAGEDDELLADRLADKLRADPTDHPTALVLAAVLERLGRDMELLALLSARMEEGDDDVRRELGPLRRVCLERLAAAASAAGRPEEASLYTTLALADD
jgi:tetratricopeptide (TPR) repeat protein